MAKSSEIKTIDNLEISNNKIVISVNPKFYSLNVVQSAVYNFLDKCYCKIYGDPLVEITVEIEPKNPNNSEQLELIGRELNNELINYAVVGLRGGRTRDIRASILERALKSHSGEMEQ